MLSVSTTIGELWAVVLDEYAPCAPHAMRLFRNGHELLYHKADESAQLTSDTNLEVIGRLLGGGVPHVMKFTDSIFSQVSSMLYDVKTSENPVRRVGRECCCGY